MSKKTWRFVFAFYKEKWVPFSSLYDVSYCLFFDMLKCVKIMYL